MTPPESDVDPVSHVLWTKKGPGNIFLLLLSTQNRNVFRATPGQAKDKGKRYRIELNVRF